MATPFFKILVTNSQHPDLSKFVESFTFEDSAKEDSFMSISMALPSDMTIAETPYLKNGVELSFKFGYLQGAYSETHKVRIVDITYRYGARVLLTVKCLDRGSIIKKSSTQKVWKGKTTIQIITEILDSYDMSFEYDEYKEGHKKWESIPQGNKNDFDFIKYLVSREVTGNYLFYIRGTRGYLVQRGNEEDSKGTYTYGDGSGVVISFDPSLKESSQSGGGNSYSIASTSSSGKSTVTKRDGIPKSGERVYTFDGDGNELSANDSRNNTSTSSIKFVRDTPTPKPIEKKVGKIVNSAVADEGEAKNLASHNKNRESARIMSAKLKIEGDPLLVPNTVINMRGVFKPHQGAWLIKKVTHSITSGGYQTDLELEKAYKSNKSKGKKKKGTNKTSKTEAPLVDSIIAFTGDGIEVLVDKVDFDRKIVGKK